MTPDDATERRLDAEIASYKAAAQEALGQLQWVSDYLASKGQRQIARTLRRNHAHIEKSLRRGG